MFYFDNAATTEVLPCVIEEMIPYLTKQYGNPGSIHTLGRDALKAVDEARSKVASVFSGVPEQILFTSGGSESNNLVIKGLASFLKNTGKTHIITTKIEHESILNTMKEMEQQGFQVSYVYPDSEGVVSASTIEKYITDTTGLISVMYVNNETGAVNPIREIGDICKDHNILFHCDCVQAAGQYELNYKELGFDFASISSHKIHGPKGMGALFVKDFCKCKISPLINGGEAQEFGFRGGTENVAAIVGFGVACSHIQTTITKRVTWDIKQRFYIQLIKKLTEFGLKDAIHVNGRRVLEDGKVLNLYIKDVDAESLILLLDSRGIYASAGSACTSHNMEPSHVLTAMGLSPEEARCSLRLSFSELNKDDNIEQAADIFAECIKMMNEVM